jgi:DNA integrity scanning protein DisA with diadenylate cyclase activity
MEHPGHESALVPACINAVVEAVKIFARHRCEAVLIVSASSTPEITAGTVLDARLSVSLLLALCAPDPLNPFRAGAVVVCGETLVRAGVPIIRSDAWDWLAHVAREVAAVVVHVSGDDGIIRLADGRTPPKQLNVRDLALHVARTVRA